MTRFRGPVFAWVPLPVEARGRAESCLRWSPRSGRGSHESARGRGPTPRSSLRGMPAPTTGLKGGKGLDPHGVGPPGNLHRRSRSGTRLRDRPCAIKRSPRECLWIFDTSAPTPIPSSGSLHQFVTFLAGAAAEPDLPDRRTSAAESGERDRMVLGEWNGAAAGCPGGGRQRINFSRFGRMKARSRVAVEAEDGTSTLGGLESRANRWPGIWWGWVWSRRRWWG